MQRRKEIQVSLFTSSFWALDPKLRQLPKAFNKLPVLRAIQVSEVCGGCFGEDPRLSVILCAV